MRTPDSNHSLLLPVTGPTQQATQSHRIRTRDTPVPQDATRA